MLKKSTILVLITIRVVLMTGGSHWLNAQTVIGGLTPDPAAMLDVQSNAKGVLFPRMTSTERDAIANAATGLVLYNTTTGCLEINLGAPGSASWQGIKCQGRIATLDCANASVTGMLSVNQSASGVSFSIQYTGGDGGLNVGQVVSSTGVTGLTATLSGGNFATGNGTLTYTITGTPNADGLAAFALDIGGQSCTLDIIVGCGAYVAAGQWKVFSCYNLGSANTAADPFTPSWEIIGNYYQWGTNPTCFGLEGTGNPCSSPVFGAEGPTASNANSGTISGWNTTDTGNGAWKDNEKTANDPCPTGFRVPTNTQWLGVLANNTRSIVGGGSWAGSPTNYATGLNFGSALFLPAAGSRDSTNGSLTDRGRAGVYWSSTELSFPFAMYLLFLENASIDGTYSSNRTYASSVRCIAE